MANIDHADWHYGGNYPAGLPPENAGTHIGIYLAWIINRELGSKALVKLGAETYQKLLRREATGRDLLLTELDEKFFSRLLNSEGGAFTRDYYETNDYERLRSCAGRRAGVALSRARHLGQLRQDGGKTR